MNAQKNLPVKVIAALLMTAALNSITYAGLAAYFPMTEGSGSSLIDVSGNGNNAALSGTSWDGSLLNFNGTTDYATAASSKSLNITTNSMTIMAWIKWDIDPQSGNQWATFVNMNADNQYRLQHNKDNTAFEFAVRTTSGGKWIYSITTPEKDQLYHVAGVYDGQALKIYINGHLENSTSLSGTILGSNKPLIIGNNSTNTRGFSGLIGDLQIYDTALSENDIALIAAAPIVPEPATLMLLGLGALSLFKRR